MADETEKIIFQIILDQVAAARNLADLKKQLREMVGTLPTDKNSDAFKTMSTGAKMLREEITKLEGATKANTQALGGVNQAAKFAIGSYGELRQNIKTAKEELQKSVIGSEDFKVKQIALNKLLQDEIDLRKEQPSLFQERVRAAVVEANSIEGLKQKLTELNTTAAKLDLNSEEFKVAQEEIIKTQDQLKIAGGRIDEFGKKVGNSTAETIEDFGKVGTAIVASFGVAETVFGESEDAQKALLAVTESIQLVQSAQAIVSGVLASKTVILTIATGAQAIATKGLELAQRGLNAAMNSNPVLLLISGLVSLVAIIASVGSAFASESDAVDKNTDTLISNIDKEKAFLSGRKDLLAQLEKNKIALDLETGKLDEELAKRRELELAHGKRITEIKLQTFEAAVKILKDAKKWETKETEFTEDEKLLAVYEAGKTNLDFQKELNKNLAIEKKLFNSEIEIITNKGIETDKKAAETAAETEKKKNKELADLRQKAFDDMFAFAVAELERQSDLDHEALQAKIEAEQKRVELELNTLIEGSEAKLSLRLQTLNTEKEMALAAVTTGSQEEANIKEEFRQKELLAREEHWKVTMEKGAQQRAETLAAELIELELKGQATTEKLIEIENEEFERQFAAKRTANESTVLLEAEHQKRLTEINKKAASERKIIAQAEFEISREILSAFGSLLEISAENEGELANFAKGIALFNIGLKTAEAIAGIVVASTAGDPYTFAIRVAAGVATILGNIAQAKKLLDKPNPKEPELKKYNYGGNIAYEGGYIPASGGMIDGRSHSTGGVRFSMGNQTGEADGRKGEAYIINTSHDPFLKAMASSINVAGGGRSFFNHGGSLKFQDGGLATRTAIGTGDLAQKIAIELSEQISRMPNPVVFVEDINTGQSRIARIEERASV